MNKLFLTIFMFLLFIGNSFATTYYASSSGGGAASCVDNTTNVCTLARAITVAAGGTNTIILTSGSGGSYTLNGTHWSFTSTNTGANLTITTDGGAVTLKSINEGAEVFLVNANMVSGSITINGVNLTSGNVSYGIRNNAPQVNLTATNTNFDNTIGVGVYTPIDATNNINLISGANAVLNLYTGATTNTKIAQKIVVGGSNISVNVVSFHLQRIGYSYGPATNNQGATSAAGWNWNTQDTVTASIQTDSAGAPSGTPVTNGTSNAVLAFNIANNQPEWTFFNFSSSVSLTASTTYWIVLTPSYSASSQFYIQADENTSNGYASGIAATFNGTIWTSLSAGDDLLFTVDNQHTRNLTATGNVMNVTGDCFDTSWSNVLTISNNTLTCGSSVLSASINNQWTTAGPSYSQVILSGNTVSSGGTFTDLISIGVPTISLTYTNQVIVKNNTGTVSFITQAKSYVKKFFFYGNTLTATYNGNCPFQLGLEVNGSYPELEPYDGFDQAIIEGNNITFSATSHNHVFLFGIGAENGRFINNTISAPNGVGAGGGGFGIVVKPDGWTFIGNKFYGPGPALYLLSNLNTVMYNTFESYDATSSDATLQLRNHQDSIYGGAHGLPVYNFIENNIFISNGTSWSAIQVCDTSDCNGTDSVAAPSLGSGRTSEYWSNRIDNNLYYARNDTTMYQIGANTHIGNAGLGAISTVRTNWASSTYTNNNSISQYNDMLNSSISNPTGINGSTGMYTPTGSNAIGKGTISGTNIGGVPSSGSGGGNGSAKMGISI